MQVGNNARNALIGMHKEARGGQTETIERDPPRPARDDGPPATPGAPRPMDMHDSSARVIAGSTLSGAADLRLLLRLRTIAIVGQTLALVVSALMIDIAVPVLPLAAGIAVLATLNVYSWKRLMRDPQGCEESPPALLDDRAFYYQVLADIAVLTYLLYYAGGPDNPFHDMFLLPLTIAAAALPWTYVWRVVVASVSGYTLVAFYNVPFSLPGEVLSPRDLMLLGAWVNHVLLALLVTYFIVRISAGLRTRDRLLEEAHAKELRNGCVVAVGSVAAGAAHELGTPLSTIQILLSELRHEYADNPAIKPNLDLMAGQVTACRNILGGLRNFVETLKKGDAPVPVDILLDEVSNRFLDIRPGIVFSKTLNGPRPAPMIIPDLAFQQAIINLLNNAADVSPNSIALEGEWTAETLTIRVRDRGPGISPELAARLGKVLVSTKAPESGTGLGLFLTNVTMSRLGGNLRLYNHDGGGACAELSLPVYKEPTPEASA